MQAVWVNSCATVIQQARRCCIIQVFERRFPTPRPKSFNRLRISYRHAECCHSIDDRTTKFNFSYLITKLSRSNPPANNRFVPVHHRLNQTSAMIVTLDFPLFSTDFFNSANIVVAAWPEVIMLVNIRTLPRRNDWLGICLLYTSPRPRD